MWLKILTSVVFAAGLGLLVGFPYLLKCNPATEQPHGRLMLAFQTMTLGYSGATLFAFITAAALAMCLVVQAREEYRIVLKENLTEMIDLKNNP